MARTTFQHGGLRGVKVQQLGLSPALAREMECSESRVGARRQSPIARPRARPRRLRPPAYTVGHISPVPEGSAWQRHGVPRRPWRIARGGARPDMQVAVVITCRGLSFRRQKIACTFAFVSLQTVRPHSPPLNHSPCPCAYHHVSIAGALYAGALVLTAARRFLLRRTAARALSASPSRTLLSKPRAITSLTPAAVRSRHQQWSIASFQRRFASDDAATTAATQAAAADTPENFAQTAAEAPVEENLTPAQQQVQAEPTDASATVGPDALEAAATSPTDSPRQRRARVPRDEPHVEPGNVLYVGNLYYEVTADQLKRVFSRFGEVESVNLIFDNRGLSRGYVPLTLFAYGR